MNSEYARHWPGESAMFMLRDGLILAVPPMYHRWHEIDRQIWKFVDAWNVGK